MPGVTSKKEQKEVLTAFRRALSQERHNLLERPEILWQQLYNRLQWAAGEDNDGPVAKIIGPEFEKRTALGARPWLHNKCRTRESEALIMVLTGHTSWVSSCAFSPDSKTLASASRDKPVRLLDAAIDKLIDIYPFIGDITTCGFSSSYMLLIGGDNCSNVYIFGLVNVDFKQIKHDPVPWHNYKNNYNTIPVFS